MLVTCVTTQHRPGTAQPGKDRAIQQKYAEIGQLLIETRDPPDLSRSAENQLCSEVNQIRNSSVYSFNQTAKGETMCECGCKKTISLDRYSGPDLDYDKSDFAESDLERPLGSWANPQHDLSVLHTFRPEIPDTCTVLAGTVRISVQRKRVGLSQNDVLVLTHDGGTRLHSQKIWGSKSEREKVLEVDLGQSGLDAVKTGSLSFMITDDTMVMWADLVVEACCEAAIASLAGLNSCRSETFETKPWGTVDIPVYGTDDLVVVDTAGSCVNGDGYFIALEVFDPISWSQQTPVFSGWVSHSATPPKLIDVASFLPPHHRSAAGGFKPGCYAFKLAVGSPWDEAHFHFVVV